MHHVAAGDFPWVGQLDTTHDVNVEVGPAHHADRYGLVRGMAWGLVFSLPLWSVLAVIAVG